jgi:hypothetical protein
MSPCDWRTKTSAQSIATSPTSKVVNYPSTFAHLGLYGQSTIRNDAAGELLAAMKNIFDVLKQKEDELRQLQSEVEALRIAARLLADDVSEPAMTAISEPLQPTAQSNPRPAAVFTGAGPMRATGPANGAYSAAWGNAPRQFP